jgi:hypothetical protein
MLVSVAEWLVTSDSSGFNEVQLSELHMVTSLVAGSLVCQLIMALVWAISETDIF